MWLQQTEQEQEATTENKLYTSSQNKHTVFVQAFICTAVRSWSLSLVYRNLFYLTFLSRNVLLRLTMSFGESPEVIGELEYPDRIYAGTCKGFCTP